MLEHIIDNAHLIAELDLVREMLLDFFAGQIEDGKIKREDVAAHIRACADRVIANEPDFASTVNQRVPRMIEELPG